MDNQKLIFTAMVNKTDSYFGHIKVFKLHPVTNKFYVEVEFDYSRLKGKAPRHEVIKKLVEYKTLPREALLDSGAPNFDWLNDNCSFFFVESECSKSMFHCF